MEQPDFSKCRHCHSEEVFLANEIDTYFRKKVADVPCENVQLKAMEQDLHSLKYQLFEAEVDKTKVLIETRDKLLKCISIYNQGEEFCNLVEEQYLPEIVVEFLADFFRNPRVGIFVFYGYFYFLNCEQERNILIEPESLDDIEYLQTYIFEEIGKFTVLQEGYFYPTDDET